MAHGQTLGKASETGAAGPEYYDSVFGRVRNFRCAPRRSRFYPLWETVVRHVPVDSKVLEVGCGTGQLAWLLHERGIRQYTGFDFASEGVAMARKRVKSFSFHVGDARDEANYEADYDVAVASEVLEHLDDDLAVFDKLRKGTRFLFSVPNSGVEVSHVRYFESVADVQAHYRPRLRRMKVGVINGEWYFVQGYVA